jgi:putative phosphoesterase
MLIGLISDTHENMPLIRKAVAYFNSLHVDYILHAGDLISPITAREFEKLAARMIAVFGNNDGERRMWRERIKNWGEIHDVFYEGQFDGLKILMMHEPRQLDALADSQYYDVIVYGHTHQVDERRNGKTVIINPGECGGWLTGRSTIAVLELPDKKISIVDIT